MLCMTPRRIFAWHAASHAIFRGGYWSGCVWCSWRYVTNGGGEPMEKEMPVEKEQNDTQNMAGCGAGGQPVCCGEQMNGVRLLPVPVPVDTVVVEDSTASCCCARWATAPHLKL
jgi:hypothetical protein